MQIVQMVVGSMGVFAYLVGCEKTGEAVAIDPAGNEGKLTAEAGKRGLRIVKIINTHAHADHTCGNHRMKELTGAPILIHSGDAPHLTGEHNRQFSQMLGCQPSPEADELLEDGQVIEAGEEVRLKVIHTPGHSPGGICLYTPGHVFTGDTLFVGGVGRTDLPGSNHRQMMDSLKNRVLSLPDDTVVWPGHHYGPQPRSTVAQERNGNPFLM